jgi:hypothetical protein
MTKKNVLMIGLLAGALFFIAAACRSGQPSSSGGGPSTVIAAASCAAVNADPKYVGTEDQKEDLCKSATINNKAQTTPGSACGISEVTFGPVCVDQDKVVDHSTAIAALGSGAAEEVTADAVPIIGGALKAGSKVCFQGDKAEERCIEAKVVADSQIKRCVAASEEKANEAANKVCSLFVDKAGKATAKVAQLNAGCESVEFDNVLFGQTALCKKADVGEGCVSADSAGVKNVKHGLVADVCAETQNRLLVLQVDVNDFRVTMNFFEDTDADRCAKATPSFPGDPSPLIQPQPKLPPPLNYYAPFVAGTCALAK